MPAVSERRPWVIAPELAVAALLAISGCAGIKAPPLSTGSGGGGGGTAVNGGGGHSNNGGGQNGAAGGPATLPDAGSCVKVACTQATGQYCGMIGDGCNGAQDCGTCPSDQICEKGVCVQGASCMPATCPTTGTLYCGKIGDGCGRALDCGNCAGNLTCNANGVCVDPGCVPMTCNGPNGVQYCGMIGDGCGGALNCTCTAGLTCGGGGIPGVCGATTCPPPLQTVQCNPTGGGQYCGTIGNGCGGIVTCPTTCPMGAMCPANGVCPGSTSTGCQNLQCQIQTCTPTTKTSISGTVYDPAGKNPLYNVQVYIPNTINGALDPVPEGVSCDQCSVTLSGFPIASALTDPMGHFTITNAPSGTNIPLVIQVGKWRREVFIPTVNPCVDNQVAADLTRLPRTQAEGHIPRIAVTTGAADALECLLRRVGIADSEFTTDAGTGRVHLYAGGGGTNSFMAGGTPFSPATALWSSPTKLAAYDVLLMSCEGSTSTYAAMKPQTSVDNVANYANSGGRLFLSHLHFYWLQHRLDFNSTAAYIGNLQAPGATSSTLVDLTINQSFPKGLALAQWLAGPLVMASPTLGTIQVAGSEHSVTGVVPPTTEWIYLPSNPRDTPLMRRSEQYLSFNTPVGTPEAMQCGKVVFTDIHIQQSIGNGAMGGDDSDPTKPFPTGCKTNPSTPQAKALEFLFFDLSACVQPDTQQPQPPLVPPPGVPTSPPPSAPPPPRVPPPPPPPPPPVIP